MARGYYWFAYLFEYHSKMRKLEHGWITINKVV